MKITFENDGRTVIWNINDDDLKKVLNVTGCCELLSLSRNTVKERLKRKWDVLLALSTGK